MVSFLSIFKPKQAAARRRVTAPSLLSPSLALKGEHKIEKVGYVLSIITRKRNYLHSWNFIMFLVNNFPFQRTKADSNQIKTRRVRAFLRWRMNEGKYLRSGVARSKRERETKIERSAALVNWTEFRGAKSGSKWPRSRTHNKEQELPKICAWSFSWVIPILLIG